jgi:sulfur carrier protein
MNIILNGEPHTLSQNIPLNQLLQELGLAQKRLAVEINLEIIPRSQYMQIELKNGDRIEIVQAIGGG